MITSSTAMSGHNALPAMSLGVCPPQKNIFPSSNISISMSNRFTSRLSDNDDYKRDELIRKIEHSVEQMTLSELEALSYDMFTKGYMEDC